MNTQDSTLPPGSNRLSSALQWPTATLFIVLCLTARFVQAELPVARLLTLFPPGAQIGNTVEVSATGVDLDDASYLLFSSTNIVGRPLPSDANKFVITVASNTLPGVYDARFVGRFGISNPRAFVVGSLPEVIEKEGNNTMAKPMEIQLGSVVNGRAEASAVDFFKFSAKKGQRVLVECAAKSIDSRMDAALVLYDGSGRELERNRKGGLLDFSAAADGDYLLKVHDFLFRGGPEYFYRLSLHTGSHIDFVFPPAGQPGTKGKYILYGRNLGARPSPGAETGEHADTDSLHPLASASTAGGEMKIDGKPLEQVEVEIELPPAATPGLRRPDVDGFEYRFQTPEGLSNPVLISYATAPVLTEQEPNNAAGQAQKISAPCEVAGRFYPAGDRDRFTFAAKKGEAYWVEVFSQRLGLPTSPFLLVQQMKKNQKGEEEAVDLQEVYGTESNIGGQEFKTGTADPAWRFDVKEDGTYGIEVRDLFNSTQSNPSHVYRLSLRKEAPDFQLVALAPAPAPIKKDAREAHVWTPFLRRGETIPIKLLALRRDNLNAEIEIAIEGLPAGVSYTETKIEGGKNSALVLLTAADDVTNWVGIVRVLGKVVGNNQLVREARGGTVIWNVPDYNLEPAQSRMTRQVVVGVNGQEAAPITIAAPDTNGNSKIWEVKAGTKARIPLRVTRRGEFTETLKLKAAGIPALDSMKEFDIDAKATNSTLELDLSQYKVPPGAYSFYLQTQTKGKYRNNPEAAQAAELAAKEAENAASELAKAVKQSADAVAAATKAASEAEAAAKSAAEKFSTAKTAAEKMPENEELLAARSGTEKEAAERTSKATAAKEAKAAAEKVGREASARLKEAEAKKTASASRAKELSEKAKPKEVTITVYSAPIRLKVIPEEKKIASGEKK